MPIRVEDYAQYERTYADQLNSQIEHVTGSLMHLDKLLVAGLVDKRVLTSFREAVDRVRTTGWLVQKSISQECEDGDIQNCILSERIRAASRVLSHLAAELERVAPGQSTEGSKELASNARRLLNALKE